MARPTSKTRRPGKAPGPLHHAGAAGVPGGFREFLVEFLSWMTVRGFSAHTLKNRRIAIGYFIDWCEARDVTRPSEVTRAMLERYRRHVFHYRRPATGAPLTLDSQGQRLTAVRVFFQWLARQHHLLHNPASELELPRQQTRLPRHILTVAEVEQILAAIDIAEPLGLRDRAMLEALYSTGMRRAELVGLRIEDVSMGRGTVLIRQGKGGKDRVVPIGARALAWIEKYLYEARPHYLDGEDGGGLFLAIHGEPMQAKQLSNIARKAIEAAKLERFRAAHPNAACHLFRHACATHMLENGADIRAIQALLGHASLSTTQVYTQVSILHLKAVHEKTHPARLDRTPGSA